jgi:SAM-dependent methyltransferase
VVEHWTQKWINQGFDVSVLEVEPNLAKNLMKLGLKTETSLAEYSDSYFPFIYSLNVLEHIEDDVTALKLISEKLCPNGELILYLPAFSVLFSEMDKRVGHYRRYRKDNLQGVLLAAGLEVKTIYYVDFLGYFASFAYKLLPNRDGSVSISAIKIFDTYLFPFSVILDRFFGKLCGKNIFAIARKTI